MISPSMASSAHQESSALQIPDAKRAEGEPGVPCSRRGRQLQQNPACSFTAHL